MRKRVKKLTGVLLAAALTFGGVGCGGGAAVSLEDLYIPTYNNDAHVRAMSGMAPNFSDRAQVETYKAAGFNFAPYAEDFFSAADVPVQGENSLYLKGLKLLEEYGIDTFLQPHNSRYSLTPTNNPCYYEQYFSDVDFRDYPAVKGFYVADKSDYGQILDTEARYLSWFNENYGGEGYAFYGNLFGCYTENWRTGDYLNKTYEDYVEKFLSTLDKSQSANNYFGIDCYPLKEHDGTLSLGDTALGVHLDAATRAKAHGAELSAFVQVFGTTNDTSYRIPTTFAEIDWGLNNVLSFGARLINFYCYREYKQDKFLGMLTEGVPNERYYFVQEAIANLRKWEHVYLSYTWEHIYANDGTGSRLSVNPMFERVKDKEKPITDVKALKSRYDVVLSEFSDGENNKAFLLTNYDEPTLQRNNKVTVTFEKAQGALYYRDGEPTTVLLDNGKFEVELESGEGVFVIPLYKK